MAIDISNLSENIRTYYETICPDLVRYQTRISPIYNGESVAVFEVSLFPTCGVTTEEEQRARNAFINVCTQDASGEYEITLTSASKIECVACHDFIVEISRKIK